MKGISEAEYQGLVLSVGTHRNARPLSPLEVAELLNKAIAAGATRAQCSEELGIGSSQVSAFLSLLLLVPQIRHLADWRGSRAASVAFSTMAELRRLKHDDQTVRCQRRSYPQANLERGSSTGADCHPVRKAHRRMHFSSTRLKTAYHYAPFVRWCYY